ncbi:MAG TPA: hypothetical protein VFY16_02795, partial [Gemmatimonadaceae bacterium]|nr:hypothetical protein [Gemmatimonadaceae bacterium]
MHYRLAEVAQVAARYLDQRDAREPVDLAELPKRREVVAYCRGPYLRVRGGGRRAAADARLPRAPRRPGAARLARRGVVAGRPRRLTPATRVM